MPAPSYSLLSEELKKRLDEEEGRRKAEEFKETMAAEAGIPPQRINERNLKGMAQAARGAQNAAASGINPKEVPIESLKMLDTQEPTDTDESAEDKVAQNNLTKTFLSFLPTAIGLGLGGAPGAAAMAGGTAYALEKEAENEQKNKAQLQEKEIKLAEIAEKREHRGFEERKLAQDRELKLKEIAANSGMKASEKAMAIAGKLRDDYLGNPLTKKSQDVSQSYAKIQEITAQEPSAAGDIALVYNFMKMQDPGSTVREGEYATAEKAAGVPERLRAMYNKMVDGEKLSPAQRQDFMGQARNVAIAQLKQQEVFDKQLGGLAKRYGIAEDEVVIKFGQPLESDLSKERTVAQQKAGVKGAPKGDVMGGQKAHAAMPVSKEDHSVLRDYLKKNPNDPRAERIRRILGEPSDK